MTTQERIAAQADLHLQLLYFTSTSLSADGRHVVAIGERDGNPNLFRIDLDNGDIGQLTGNEDGILRSYVYFEGQPYRGLGKASVSFDAVRGVLYYLQGREIRAVDLEGRERVLATLPGDQVTAFTHVSADGTRLCVPTTDAAAFTEDAAWSERHKGIDARVRRLGLKSYLRVYATETGEELACESVPSAWVTHVQFSPNNAEHILYNHEWPADCGIRRVWLWDGKQHRALRSEGNGRSRKDWTCHEMWERDGEAVIYHGLYEDGRAYIGRIPLSGAPIAELALPQGWGRYGHFTVGPSRADLVTDGYYHGGAEDGSRTCPWISHLDVDWDSGRVSWRVLGRSDSSWDSQDSHPHPILDAAGDFVYFTSDKEGKRAIYRLPVGATDTVAEVELHLAGR